MISAVCVTLCSSKAKKVFSYMQISEDKRYHHSSEYEFSRLLNVHDCIAFQVAIYSRKDLNIRGASTFLLAYAANNVRCRPFLKKYFKATIALPSDWIEVAEIYQVFSPPASCAFSVLFLALSKYTKQLKSFVLMENMVAFEILGCDFVVVT